MTFIIIILFSEGLTVHRNSSSDVNKDLGLKVKAKAKDLGPKAKAKDSRYQDQIFHRSSYILSDIVARCRRIISPLFKKLSQQGLSWQEQPKLSQTSIQWAQIPYHKDEDVGVKHDSI